MINKYSEKLTEEQRLLISSHRLRPDNWIVLSDTKHELEIKSKRSAQRRILQKTVNAKVKRG